MYTSQIYFPTLKEPPKDADLISHQLMQRAGLIRQLASGIYTWLPLGVRILRKIETIVRQEMDEIGAQECLMPMVQPAELWNESERWHAYGLELLRLKDRHQRDFCLGPTHEEVVTDLVRNEVRSYKQLPLILYQIQTKFRDEIRPRFGIMRAREFLMKDAYSFHVNQASLEKTYQAMYEAYVRIFNRLGLKIEVVKADTGSIGGHTSHEFQVLAASGEDQIFYDPETNEAINRELLAPKGQDTSHLQSVYGIEVGHIFQLGTKYSKAMHLSVATKTAKKHILEMGCYGIGIARIVAAAIEQNYDVNGMIWPKAMAPFQLVLIPIQYNKIKVVKEFTDALYTQIKTMGIEVLLENRDTQTGISFKEMDLLGIPHQVIISQEYVLQCQVEYKARHIPRESRWLSQEALMNFLQSEYTRKK